MKTRHGRSLALVVMLALGACTSGSDAADAPATSAPTSSEPSPPTSGATITPFEYSTEPVAIEPGTYRIPKSAWSVVDFTVTFPEGWTVQYGHVFATHTDTDEELGFYAVVVDAIYADACEPNGDQLMEVGPSVDDLATALLKQPGPRASGPVDTTLGGYPASRIDLTVPKGFDMKACRLEGLGLQVWYSPPADKYFVLLPDGIASVYIVDGQRQVFLTQYRSATSDQDVRELQAVLDSIYIET
jgi:hypothetical protein